MERNGTNDRKRREKYLRNRGEVPSWQKQKRSEIMLKKFNEQEKFGKQIYIPM